jgi:hypothetical protein
MELLQAGVDPTVISLWLGHESSQSTKAYLHALLSTAREAMRKALAWESIVKDDRLQQQLTQGQATDAKEKTRNHRSGAETAVRVAWSHILFPVKTDSTAAGSAFDLDHLSVMVRDRAPRSRLPSTTRAKSDGAMLSSGSNLRPLPLGGDAAPSTAQGHVTFGPTTMAKASPCPGTFGPHSPWRRRGGASPDL